MTLDRSTYEAWLLDRIEGALTSGQELELDAFLLANPDLPLSFDELPHVDADEEAYTGKKALHRDFPPGGTPDAIRLNDFLVARLEGGLSAEQAKELDRHLYEHPEVARDASLMAMSKVEREAIPFGDKASISRHFPPLGLPDKHRLADFLIAEAEGDLGPKQHAALKQYLNEHAGAKREQQLVAAAFVERDALVFPGKDLLRKRAVRVLPIWPRLAATASIAMLLSAGWWLLRERRPVENSGIARIDRAVQHAIAEHQATAHEASAVRSGIPVPETPRSQGNDAARNLKGGTTIASQDPDPPPTEQASVGMSRPPDRPLPALEPIQHITRAAIPYQALAQASTEETDRAIAVVPVTAQTTTAANSPSVNDGSLGAFLANRMRSDILDVPRRDAEFDGTDAVAMADRAIGKITGGQGGVDVQRSATRDRIQVRLGRNFSLSASRGR